MANEDAAPFARAGLQVRAVITLLTVLGAMGASALATLGTPEWGETSPLHMLLTYGFFLALVGGALLALLGPALARLLPRRTCWSGPVSAFALSFTPFGLLLAQESATARDGIEWGSCLLFALVVGGGVCGMMAAERLRHASPPAHPILGWTLPLILAAGIGLACRLGVEANPWSHLMAHSASSRPAPSPDGTRVAQAYRTEDYHPAWRTMWESPLCIWWTLEVVDRNRVRRTTWLDRGFDEGLDEHRAVRFTVAWDTKGESIVVRGGVVNRTLTVFDLGHSLIACDGVYPASGTPGPLPAPLAKQLRQIGRPADEVSRLQWLVAQAGRLVVHEDGHLAPLHISRPAIVCDDPNVLLEVPSHWSGTSIVARGPVLVRAGASPSLIASQQWVLIEDPDQVHGGRFLGETVFVLTAPRFSLDTNRSLTVVPPTK